MKDVLTLVRKELKNNADEQTKEGAKRYFKEEIKVYGVKAAVVQKIAKEYFKSIKNEEKDIILAWCEELWQSGFMEESFIACNWSYELHKKYEPKDFEVFERWVKKYVTNWASCDTLCNHTVSAFIEMYPEYLSKIKKWANSENRWVKRASAVTFIIPARNGKFLNDIFEIADVLLEDKDDMIQKGYGWMLKAASESHRQEVFDYVMKNKVRMPRTALRYAIEKMPSEMKAEAMKR